MGKTGKRGNGEGSAYLRSDGRWSGFISLEDGTRKYYYGKSQKEVLQKIRVARNEQEQGTLITTPQQTLEHFLKDWLESSQKQSVRPRTYERYEEIVRLHIIPVLGRHKLQSLTAQHLQAFYAKKIKEGLSPTTVGAFHNVLHKALDTAMKWNLVPRNVCKLASPPRAKRFEVQSLNVEQIHKLLVAAKGHYMEALFNLALATGMRRAELMGLKWQDIDMSKGVVQVRRILSRVPSKMDGKGYVEAEPKTQKSRRSIVIASFALEALRQHRIRQLEAKLKAGPDWQEHDYVFCTSVGTHIHPTRDMADSLDELLEKAGLPHIRFHDLRHSAASLLLNEGVHPKVVQEILGHSQISMTMDVYSHVLPSMQQDAMDKLNKAVTATNEDDNQPLQVDL